MASAEAEQPKRASSPASPAELFEAYIDHASRFWAAGETNADRLTKQVRLLTAICAAFFGTLVVRASSITNADVYRNIEAAPFLGWSLATMVLLFLADLFRGPNRWRLILLALCIPGAVYMLSDRVMATRFGGDSPWASTAYVRQMSIGVAWGGTMIVLLYLVWGLHRLLLPLPAKTTSSTSDFLDGESNADTQAHGDIASGRFRVSRQQLRQIRARLGGERYRVFMSTYSAALQLHLPEPRAEVQSPGIPASHRGSNLSPPVCGDLAARSNSRQPSGGAGVARG